MNKSHPVMLTIAIVAFSMLSPGTATANPKAEQHRLHTSKKSERSSSEFEKSTFYRATIREDEESAVLRKKFGHPLQQWREDIVTTVFYVGEYKRSRVGLLNNRSSAWIAGWVKKFGGVDHPGRNTVFPTKFKPKENPFYFALPLSDKSLRSVETNEILPEFQETVIFFNRIYSPNSHLKSFLKNTWIAIECNGKTCYAQWQDVGPYVDDDAGYVLLNDKPKYKHGSGPGLDVSPAIQKYLGMSTTGVTRWRFVAPSEVPDGPWTKIVSDDLDEAQMAAR